ncbi:hypothetical protein [Nostoc sp.]|uniref:hypothetical protein n=1 Tax=Nostoc sp. TaxID=1180 RepID=UPI002FFC70DB
MLCPYCVVYLTVKRIEAIARPRLSYMCTTLPSRVTIGIAIACIKLNNILH